MARTLGIIPAAGRSERWGGYPKYLLPYKSTGTTLLEHSIRAMNIATDIVVITPPEGLPWDLPWSEAQEIPQQGNHDIWSAIETALELDYDYYYFGMPDTLYPEDIFERMAEFPEADFQIGIFETKTPERFGVYSGGRWVNKQKLTTMNTYTAWGTLGWSRWVADLWRSVKMDDYTYAINLAREATEPTLREVHAMDFYYDMATFEDYVNYIKETYGEGQEV